MDSGGLTDFLSQVWGLVVLTVGSGILWVVLMFVISRRAAERRRRKREGLEPLPSFFTQAWRWINQQTEEKPKPAVVVVVEEVAVPTPAASYTAAVPTPDFDLLTSDLPLPDIQHLTTPLADDIDAILSPVKSGEIVEPPPVAAVAAPPPPPQSPAPAVETAALEAPVYSMELNYVPGSNELPHDAVEVMRVWRDVTDGTLIVGIKDQLFATSSELRNADIARRFSVVMRELNALALAAGLSVGSVAAAAPVATRPAAPPPPAAAPRPGKKGEIPEPVEPPKLGIADEIEDYLQQRLAVTPRFANRNIHVRAGTGGGVSIEVDGRRYETVNDVEDLIVRDFLQATIQEWSEHH